MTSGEHTKGADLLALADRVEKLTGPDREVDHEIHAKVVAPHLYDHIMWPAYTASLDAAMTLVPEGIYWMAAYGKRTPQEPIGACALYRPGVDAPFIEVEANSVALALTAACLRALTRFREAQAGGGV